MKRDREAFRGRLLASESWDSPARDRYEQTVKALVAHKLTTAQRWAFMFLSLVLAFSTVLFVWLAATQTQVPILARMLFVEAASFAVALVAYLVTVLKRGVFHRRNMPTFVSSLMWVFALVLSTHFVALIPWVNNINVALFFLGVAMIVVAGTGLQLIRVCIEQSELNTHERLLEMLYRMAGGQPDSETRNN